MFKLIQNQALKHGISLKEVPSTHMQSVSSSNLEASTSQKINEDEKI